MNIFKLLQYGSLSIVTALTLGTRAVQGRDRHDDKNQSKDHSSHGSGHASHGDSHHVAQSGGGGPVSRGGGHSPSHIASGANHGGRSPGGSPDHSHNFSVAHSAPLFHSSGPRDSISPDSVNVDRSHRGGIASSHSFRSSGPHDPPPQSSRSGVGHSQHGFASVQPLDRSQIFGRDRSQSRSYQAHTFDRSSSHGFGGNQSGSPRGSRTFDPLSSGRQSLVHSHGFANGGLHHSSSWAHDAWSGWHGHWHGGYGGHGGGYGGYNDSYGCWDGDWCPDYDWGWHHHHRFFWGGGWVVGDYPCYGYQPGAYVIDQSPRYAQDNTVVSVQSALADAGYYDGPIDGIASAATSAAIAHYQADHDMPVSGLIDDVLMESLNVGPS